MVFGSNLKSDGVFAGLNVGFWKFLAFLKVCGIDGRTQRNRRSGRNFGLFKFFGTSASFDDGCSRSVGIGLFRNRRIEGRIGLVPLRFLFPGTGRKREGRAHYGDDEFKRGSFHGEWWGKVISKKLSFRRSRMPDCIP